MDWTEDQLAHIGEAQDCRIAVEIGGGFPKRTTVWIVRCGDALYVRPYFGAESRWYNAALDANRGEVDADGETFGVTFALEGDAAPNDAIDAAYRAKYGSGPAAQYVPPMISSGPRAATVRLVSR
ncbi:DUF2255 family protein [Propioniciclava sp.]|uniref:DUF2255 family protein n=1 Tax=Propioniciclava sp. TaxID=2038686 RepID=UPI002611810C|nr:DUF2255 family protein [Propioniciclava sp.]